MAFKRSIYVFLMVFTSVYSQNITPPNLESVKSYLPFYGQILGESLNRYDMLILQPQYLSPNSIQELKAEGIIVLAYLSIGEVNSNSPWFLNGKVRTNWLLGKNELWGSYYVDSTQSGWRDLILDLAQEYLDQGFDGFLLDTVDTIDIYSETGPAMVELIKNLDSSYPNALFLQNRGFSLLNDIGSNIDGLVYENFSALYNFKNQSYELQYDSNLDKALTFQKLGKPVFTLDYAQNSDYKLSYQALSRAQSYGFIGTVTEIFLISQPNYLPQLNDTDNLAITKIDVMNRTEISVSISNLSPKPSNDFLLELSINGQALEPVFQKELKAQETLIVNFIWDKPQTEAFLSARLISLTDNSPQNNHYTYHYQASVH